MEPLRESRGGSVFNERERTLPAVLLPVSLPAGRGRADIALASGQAVCISSDQDTATGVMQDQGGGSVGVTHRTELAEPALIPRLDGAAGGTALADPHQEGYAIPGGRLGVAPQPGNVEPSCVAASGLLGELSALQSRVRDTLTEARAPSTRRLYASKWGVFVKWCGQAHIDPATCTVSDVLSFLQHRLDSGSCPSTLKVYVAAITAFRSPQSGQSFGKNTLVVSFLKGAKRLHPPRPPSVPPWDLEVVLKAISLPPFEPLTSVGLKELSLDRSASFRQSDQLFVCYGGSTKGQAVSKQRLSHWIVDAITEAYASQGLECPLHIRGHSTRAIASSWAWARGMSIPDICLAAGWSSQNTFARFYKLDVQSLASQVLSVSN